MMRSVNGKRRSQTQAGRSYMGFITTQTVTGVGLEGKIKYFVYFHKVFSKAIYDRATNVLVGLPESSVDTPVGP